MLLRYLRLEQIADEPLRLMLALERSGVNLVVGALHAVELESTHLAAVTHSENAAALFAEDGAVELPFLHSLGIPWRHGGRQAISELQDSLAGFYLDFGFPPEDTHVLIYTP